MENKYIHIGNEIKQVLKEKHLRPTDLARLLKMSKAGITSLLRRQTMQLDLLMHVSVALEHDFFILYCNCPEVPKVGDIDAEMVRLEKALADSESKVGELVKEVTYLKEINALLRKQDP